MLKKVAKGAGALLASVLGVAGALALYVQVDGIPRYAHSTPERRVAMTPEHVARGRKIATVLCASCHMNPTTGRLTGKHMEDAPAELGVIYSRNITRSPAKGVGAWSDGEIAYLLRTGVRPDGQYVPPYMVKVPHLSDDDLDSVIAFLRSDDPMVAATETDAPGTTRPTFLTKALSHVAFKPLPLPTQTITAPPRSDRVAYGRYLTFGLDCFGCHSADFKTMNVAEPEKTPGYMGGGNELNDLHGGKIASANLTPDAETGIGSWSERDFVRAVREGFRPGGVVVRYPMAPMPELDDDEVAAIYAYLRTVPAVRNRVTRAEAVPAGADEGKRLYFKYACVSCHGESGIGLADLRRANENFSTDEELRTWIMDAPKLKPGTKMPAWRGIIAEGDYPALMGYVRNLSRAKEGSAKKSASR